MTGNLFPKKMIKAATGAAAFALFAGVAVSACGGAAAPHSSATAGKTATKGLAGKGSSSGAETSTSGHTSLPAHTTAETWADQAPAIKDGPGWSLAITDPHDAKKDTLVLVSPTGVQRVVTSSLPLGSALDSWSGDGQRAMVTAAAAGDGNVQVSEIDLANGAVLHQFTQPNSSGIPTYTEPHGLAMLQAGVAKNGSVSLVRESLSGSLELEYPTTFPGARRPTPTTEPDFDGAYLESPDGTEIVMGSNLGMAVVSNEGTILRSIQVPTYNSCAPLAWVAERRHARYLQRRQRRPLLLPRPRLGSQSQPVRPRGWRGNRALPGGRARLRRRQRCLPDGLGAQQQHVAPSHLPRRRCERLRLARGRLRWPDRADHRFLPRLLGRRLLARDGQSGRRHLEGAPRRNNRRAALPGRRLILDSSMR